MKPTTCLCGCGRPTQNEFAPGHDARYKSQLLRRLIEDDDSEALQILTRRRWTKFIEPARRQAKIKAERAVKRERRVKKETVQSDPGHFQDRVSVMKGACQILKMSGQYHRSSGNYYEIVDWVDGVVVLAGENEDLALDVQPHHWAQVDPQYIEAARRLIDHPDVELYCQLHDISLAAFENWLFHWDHVEEEWSEVG